ncbi:bacteriophage protein [Mycobacteroides abscessus subsp. massiliense]|nr:bacteriophage protein [Mycobacteroides abscessus subsp. massiliense]
MAAQPRVRRSPPGRRRAHLRRDRAYVPQHRSYRQPTARANDPGAMHHRPGTRRSTRRAELQRRQLNPVRVRAHGTEPSQLDRVPQRDTAHSVADVLARNLGELDDRNATVRELVDVILPRLDEHVRSRPSSAESGAGGCPCAAGTPKGIRWFALATCARYEQSVPGTRSDRRHRWGAASTNP